MSKITTSKIKNSDTKTELGQESMQQKVDRLTLFVEKNAKVLALSFVALLVLCSGYFVFSLYSENSALKIFEKSYTIEKRISEFTIADTDPSAEIKKKKSPESDATEFEQLNQDVSAFIKEYPKSEASRNLVLKWSNYLYSVDKFEMALQNLELLKTNKVSSLGALTELAKASNTVQLGKLDQAIGIYKAIIANKNWNYVHPEARFQMSLALIENKKEQEALDNLKTIIQEHPKERKTIEEATKIIRWLTYKKNSEPGKN